MAKDKHGGPTTEQPALGGVAVRMCRGLILSSKKQPRKKSLPRVYPGRTQESIHATDCFLQAEKREAKQHFSQASNCS